MQFGFMKGKGTIDAIFMVRQMQEKFKATEKKLCFGFLDSVKVFDRVPREVILWAMCKLGVEEWLVLAVMPVYTGAKTVVRTVYGNSNGFEVKVGMHQGSALSPLLFLIVMEAFSREFRIGWNKFRQLLPLLTNKDISLIVRGMLYSSCAQSSMLQGSETWSVRKENEVALQQAEMRMVRWMCSVTHTHTQSFYCSSAIFLGLPG